MGKSLQKVNLQLWLKIKIKNKMIHQTAIISPKAQIGNNVKIGPYCIVGEDAIIGNNVEIQSHVIIEGKTTIGEGTVIYPFASIGQPPQVIKYSGEKSRVLIGKNNKIREYVTIQSGTLDGGMLTQLGDNCLLMVGVHIAHDCIVGNNVILANYASLAGHVSVGDFAIIGGLSAVQQFCRVGEHTMIGGVSAVVKDLVPFGLAVSDRASLEGLNLVGMNRRGFDKSKSLEASKAIKEIFAVSQGSVFNAKIEEAKVKYSDNEIIQQIIEFVQKDLARTFCALKKE
jgi:UDP-N-acetylglucosamine acyltransferase